MIQHHHHHRHHHRQHHEWRMARTELGQGADASRGLHCLIIPIISIYLHHHLQHHHHHHHNHHLNWDIIITIVLMTINFPRVCTKLLRGSGKGAPWLWGWWWRASWGWWRWWSSRCQKFPPGLCHHCLGQPKVNTVHHPTQSKRQSAAQGVLARKRKKRSLELTCTGNGGHHHHILGLTSLKHLHIKHHPLTCIGRQNTKFWIVDWMVQQ